MDIINFVQISENIASSGQPLERDFKQIACLGYKTVINLALMTSDNAIVTEGDIITDLGMSYLHIPVQWQKPTCEQFKLFVAVMQQQITQKVWVHCALNMRASAFLYLYSTLYLNFSKETALQKLNRVWQPNETWSQFIASVQIKYI
jgi:protein tyrosine phosphatase (PTP) superfamily phosphohydrolase (DUF442 family)